MDILFEITGTPDLHAIIEMRYRLNAKRIGIPVGLYLLMGAFFLRRFLQGYTYLFLPVLIFGFAVYMALLPYLQVRKGWKKDVAFHHGKLPVNTARFGEKISIENVEASRNWEYYQLTKVCSFKRSYCLCFGDNTVLVLNRANFTKGTFEEFKQFLRARRPDLKIPE